MKINIIKIGTLLLFASLITFFVMVKSGCSPSYEKRVKKKAIQALKSDEYRTDYVNQKRVYVRKFKTDTFFLVKELIYGPKAPFMTIDANDILDIFVADTIEEDYVYDSGEYEITYFTQDVWLKMQELKKDGFKEPKNIICDSIDYRKLYNPTILRDSL